MDPVRKPYSRPFSTENPEPGATLHPLTIDPNPEDPVLPILRKTKTPREPRPLSFLRKGLYLGTCGRQVHIELRPWQIQYPFLSGASTRGSRSTRLSSEPLPLAPQFLGSQNPRVSAVLTPKNFLSCREAWESTQPERRREAAVFPQESWAPVSEITAGQDCTVLPYPPARPWSRGRGNGEEEAGAVAAPLSSRRSLGRGRHSALGASGMRRLRRPGRTKPHLAWGTACHRPTRSTPRPWDSAPPPCSGFVEALAPPSVSDSVFGCPS